MPHVRLPLHIMTFVTIEGLEKPSFNTIRLGQSWAKKLKVGDKVILAHKDRAIGLAEVTATERGRAPEVVAEHWKANHSGMTKGEISEALVKTYGPQRVTATSWLSVVYLQPLSGEHYLHL